MRVVIGILRRGQYFLIAQRPVGKSYSGYWEFPGGKIEKDESGILALKRELDEELGISVTSARLFFEQVHAYPDQEICLEIWRVDTFLGEPYGKENQCIRWVTVAEMKEMKILAGNSAIIDKLKYLE